MGASAAGGGALAFLAGPRVRLAHALVVIALAATALVTYLLPAHEVYETTDLRGLGCAFSPDCDPSMFETVRLSAPVAVHSEYDHGGPLPMLILLAIAALAGAWGWRLPPGLAAAAMALASGAAVGTLVLGLQMDHLLTRTRTLPAGELHGYAVIAIAFVSLLGLPPLALVALLERWRARVRRRRADP